VCPGWLLKEPAAQLLQPPNPALPPNLPGAQGRQAADVLLPESGLKVPAGHQRQALYPSLGVYCPGLQSEHAALPEVPVKDPAGHLAHTEALEAPWPAAENLPAAHG
jgi:hypothetical protein